MAFIIPVASGKGGVGKTMFVANLGYSLSKLGFTTVVVDLDLGGSNLHTYLGIKNNKKGLGSFILGDEEELLNLIIKTDYKKLFMLMGDSLIPNSTNLSYLRKKQIIESIKQIEADYVIIDLGAGSDNNIIDFFSISPNHGIIVTNPEITAILNAYAFIKTFLFRSITSMFQDKPEEKKYLNTNLSKKIEGTQLSFPLILQGVKDISKESYDKIIKKINNIIINVTINKSKGNQSINIVNNLRKISRDNLGIETKYIGYIPHQDNLGSAILKKKLAIEIFGSEFCGSFEEISDNIKNNFK